MGVPEAVSEGGFYLRAWMRVQRVRPRPQVQHVMTRTLSHHDRESSMPCFLKVKINPNNYDEQNIKTRRGESVRVPTMSEPAIKGVISHRSDAEKGRVQSMCYPAPSLPGRRLAGPPSYPHGYSPCPAAAALAGWVATSLLCAAAPPKVLPHPLLSSCGKCP